MFIVQLILMGALSLVTLLFSGISLIQSTMSSPYSLLNPPKSVVLSLDPPHSSESSSPKPVSKSYTPQEIQKIINALAVRDPAVFKGLDSVHFKHEGKLTKYPIKRPTVSDISTNISTSSAPVNILHHQANQKKVNSVDAGTMIEFEVDSRGKISLLPKPYVHKRKAAKYNSNGSTVPGSSESEESLWFYEASQEEDDDDDEDEDEDEDEEEEDDEEVDLAELASLLQIAYENIADDTFEFVSITELIPSLLNGIGDNFRKAKAKSDEINYKSLYDKLATGEMRNYCSDESCSSRRMVQLTVNDSRLIEEMLSKMEDSWLLQQAILGNFEPVYVLEYMALLAMTMGVWYWRHSDLANKETFVALLAFYSFVYLFYFNYIKFLF